MVAPSHGFSDVAAGAGAGAGQRGPAASEGLTLKTVVTAVWSLSQVVTVRFVLG